MKVLVVGGSGFIGKNFLLKTPKTWNCFATYNSSENFINFLSSHNLSHVKPLKVDLTDEHESKEILSQNKEKFDLCLYVMGNSDIGLSRTEPLADVKANVHTLVNVLQNILAKKFIFMSSGAVYEGHDKVVDPTVSLNPIIPYAIDKYSSEQLVKYYQSCVKNIDEYINVRFFGAFGPMEPSRKIYTNLIKTFSFEGKDHFTLWGNGKNLIDAMYIDDTIDALMTMGLSDKGNITVDLSYGQPLTINELVYEVGKILEKDITLEHKGDAAEYTTFFPSTETMKRLFNFKAKTSLREGILKFREYLRDRDANK